MTSPDNRRVELRLLKIAALFLAAGTLLTWACWGTFQGASFLCGGALAAVSMLWLRRVLNTAILQDRKSSKRLILAGFLLRLLLIPLCLYAMIRFLFLGIPAAVAGFAACHCSILVEGILEALSIGSRKNARAK